MRQWLLCLCIVLSGCDWLSPPCVKVSRAICDVGTEGDACAFVLNLGRDDERSQEMCKQILGAAKALGADPKSESAQNDWKEARATLGTLGFTADALKGRIETKLKQAGGVAGRLVEDLEKNSAAAEKRTEEGAEKAFDAVNK